MMTSRSRSRRIAMSGITLSVAGLLMLLLAAGAWATGEYEPNDNRDTVAGPLEGGKSYTATIETDNDVDWYVFYVKTYSQMDISATMVKSESECRAIYRLLDKDGRYIDSFVSGFVNETRHLLLTLTPGRYYLEVDSCTKDSYRFRIDPSTAITASRECGEAIVAKDAVGPQLAKVAGELSENGEELAKASGVANEAKATLLGLDRRWAKFNAKWKAEMRKLNRRHWSSGYAKRRKRRNLIATKRRTNQRLQAEKATAKRDLATARTARGKVIEERSGLQSLETQHKSTFSQAESQIALHC